MGEEGVNRGRGPTGGLNIPQGEGTSLWFIKLVKGIKLEGVWDKLQSKKGFQRLLFAKCLRLTLVFIWDSALPGGFNFCFARVFC